MPSPVLFQPFLLPERVASVGALGPVFQPSLAFHLVFYLVGQRGKEVYARDAFHLVYRVDILRLEPSAGVVAIDEAYAARLSPQTYDDLEEGFGHRHLVLAYPLVALSGQHGSAHDVQIAPVIGPVAALLLQYAPVAVVERMELWADVGHQETVGLGLS